MVGGWTKMTRKLSYEVFSLTFLQMKTSYDDMRAFPCYKISGNYVTFCALRGFSSLSRHLLERRTCVEYVRVRADMLARSCMMTSMLKLGMCSMQLTQKKRLIQNFIYLKSPPSVTGFYQYALFFICLSASIYVQHIANVRVCVCVCVRERERERAHVWAFESVCMPLCMRARAQAHVRVCVTL